jgi:hypothetical protein
LNEACTEEASSHLKNNAREASKANAKSEAMYSGEEERCVYLGAVAMERMDVAEEWRGATKNVCCCCEAAAVFVFVWYRCVFYTHRILVSKYGLLRGPGRRLRCKSL